MHVSNAHEHARNSPRCLHTNEKNQPETWGVILFSEAKCMVVTSISHAKSGATPEDIQTCQFLCSSSRWYVNNDNNEFNHFRARIRAPVRVGVFCTISRND